MAIDPVVRTYDSKQITISYLGTSLFNYADGDFLTVTSAENFESRTGSDGSEDRINKNETGLDVEVTLMKTSISNDILNGFYEVDRLTNLGKGAFLAKDLGGTMFVESSQAYIKKRADITLSNGTQAITWSFRLPQALYTPGFNL